MTTPLFCDMCSFTSCSSEEMLEHRGVHRTPEAKRNPVDFRYDLLDSEFLLAMAQIASYGANKYGDINWQKSRLTGEKSPLNHIYMHLHQYKTGIEHDYYMTKKMQ